MVNSVMAVPLVGKTRREQERAYEYHIKRDGGAETFARVLDESVERLADAPTQCHTITYGRDSQIRQFLYQTREYHY